MRSVPNRVRLLAATPVCLLCVACGGGGGGGANASCVAPYLDAQADRAPRRGLPTTVSPGGTVTLYGHWYTSTCNDTGGHDPMVPLPPVRLALTLPDGSVQRLGTFRPGGEDLGFSVAVQVPADAGPGTATVSDDRDPPATFRIRIPG